MSVKKRSYRSGKTVWYYVFDAPGSTRTGRRQITESGFATKREAEDAEAKRRTEEQARVDAVKAGSVDAPLPNTLAMLLRDFLAEHAEKKLAAKTVERYREQAAYLSSALLSMPMREITALHLSREWNRLLERGAITGKLWHHDRSPLRRSATSLVLYRAHLLVRSNGDLRRSIL
jgi:hypothetical protein